MKKLRISIKEFITFYSINNLNKAKIPIYRAVHNHSTLKGAVIFSDIKFAQSHLPANLQNQCNNKKFNHTLHLKPIPQADCTPQLSSVSASPINKPSCTPPCCECCFPFFLSVSFSIRTES